MLSSHNQKKAIEHLSKDPIMKLLIVRHELSYSNQKRDIFLDIVESIINQQLSSKAGTTIFNRFKALFPRVKKITPKHVLKISDDKIRSCGISRAKVSFIKGLSRAIQEKELIIDRLYALSDEDVITELVKIKGIGKWTAEMILMFSLQRQDIFSIGDLGLCTAVAKLYGVDRSDKKKIEDIAIQWSPYRTIASRYLWRSLDTEK